MRETNSISATVKALPGNTARLGIVVVGAPNFPAGSYLALRRAGRTIYARSVWLFNDTGPRDGEVWLDEWQRDNLGVALEEAVQAARVPREQVRPLQRVELAAATVPPASLTADLLAEFMARKQFPLYPGFRFEFSPLDTGETLLFQVRRCGRSGQDVEFGIATAQTTVEMQVDQALRQTVPTISYEDVGGLADEVREVREAVELPIRMRNSTHRLGVSALCGILLYGPPGTGKTLLARAVVRGAGVPLFTLHPSQLAGHPSDAEQKLNAVFDQAEASPRGAILLLDELDNIGGKRDEPGPMAASLANVLLTRLDGLKTRGQVVVIGTTSRPEAIDPSLRRHGRFSREVHVPAPHEAGRLQILQIHARRLPLAGDDGEETDRLLPDLARQTRGFVGADLAELCREAGLSALRRAHPLAELDRGNGSPQAPLWVTRTDFERALTRVRPSALKEVLVTVPDVSFANIGGLDEVVAEVRERVLGPLRHADVFAAMGLPAEKGILLYGPPGTGKTMLAKAIAHECGSNFLVVQGPELLSKWVGSSEEGVRRVFARARQLAPTVVLFDEIEALLPERGRRPGDSGVTDRVVNQFLTEMDGIIELRGVTVIGSTNRPELIDAAVLRPGRLGTHIRVPLPEEGARLAILRLNLGTALADDVLRSLAHETANFSGADLAGLCNEGKRLALREVQYARVMPVTEAHLRQALTQLRQRRPELLPGETGQWGDSR